MKNVQLKTISLSNGETYGYRLYSGGSKKIVLVHGNMTSSKHFDILIEALPEEYTIYAMDMRGFGISSYNTPINSLKDFSDDLKLFVDALGLEQFDLLGWSTGGGVCMIFAANNTNMVNKLFLVESVGTLGYPIYKKDIDGKPIYSELLLTKEEIASDPIQVAPVLVALEKRDKEFYRTLWNAAIYTQKQPDPDKYEEYLEDNLTQRNLVDVDFALTRFNLSSTFNGMCLGTGEAAKITMPTLIIQGDKDLVVPMSMSETIKNDIGSNAEIVIIKNSGHSPFIDALEEIVELIVRF